VLKVRHRRPRSAVGQLRSRGLCNRQDLLRDYWGETFALIPRQISARKIEPGGVRASTPAES
jgi:hypothetical protein